jgi:transcriptional regulator with XRE-family HTH domain
MAIMAKPDTGQRQRQKRNRRTTVYGRFLRWVMFRYNLTQEQLADTMGISQSTIPNWLTGKYEASWRANMEMADKLRFGRELKALHAKVYAYGQGTPAPLEDPPNMPYALAELVISDEEPNPEASGLPGGAHSPEDLREGLDAAAKARQRSRTGGVDGPDRGGGT